MQQLETFFNAFANFMWGTPLVLLLVGGGVFFSLYSRLKPYRYFPHAIALIRGKYDQSDDPGDVPHSQALSTALSGTLGLGNIAGVAIAISMGGPGAIFWMWVTAIVGVSTKFYTASLSVMYRGTDSQGQLQGGPMYVVREGLGPRWYPLAILFALAGLFGTLPIFQANQLIQLVRENIALPYAWITPEQSLWFDLGSGSLLAIAVTLVVMGKIQRIGQLTVRLVPAMVLIYLGLTLTVVGQNIEQVPAAFALIVTDAFEANAVAGGSIASVIMIGVRRGAFSNEAGIGTESMAHGAAKTQEPIREGLVAMTGPVIDTLVVCTCTALMIILTGVWQQGDQEGISITANAFQLAFSEAGLFLLFFMVLMLSFSTIVTFWLYGVKCLGFLIGAEKQHYYTPVYIGLILVGAMVSLDVVNGLLVGMYALMAIPTMVSSLLLAPKVNKAAKAYFSAITQSKP